MLFLLEINYRNAFAKYYELMKTSFYYGTNWVDVSLNNLFCNTTLYHLWFDFYEECVKLRFDSYMVLDKAVWWWGQHILSVTKFSYLSEYAIYILISILLRIILFEKYIELWINNTLPINYGSYNQNEIDCNDIWT